jgi:polar amino acid transport system substrate-binding protein
VEGAIGHELNLVGTVADAAQRRRFRVVDVAPDRASGMAWCSPVGISAQRRALAWQRLIEDLRLDGGLARIMLRNAPLDVAAGSPIAAIASLPRQDVAP